MKKIALIALALVLCVSAATAMGSKEGPATATKYFVAHQGGYVGAATVSVDAAGKVTAASIEEWQGPGGWVDEQLVDGKEVIQPGSVVRVPDPLANLASTDPEVKGYRFYMYNLQADGVTYIWSQAGIGKDGFTKPTRQFERDFEGLMGNPILAKAYVEAARADKLVNVTFKDGKIVVGKKASETVHYGHMDKANAASVYMPIGAGTIGYRYNNKATLEFFKANPLADFTAAKTSKVKVTLVADKAVEPADIAVYTAATDDVYTVADVVTGATYSDFQHYSLELQAAYKLALAEARIAATK